MAHEVDIEQVHHLLDEIEGAIHTLDREQHETINTAEIEGLWETFYDAIGFVESNFDNPAKRLSVSPSTLKKFRDIDVEVPTATARALANRLRSVLRSLDTPTASQVSISTAPVPIEQPETRFKAEEWIVLEESADIKRKIYALSEILDSIVTQLRYSNEPEESQALTRLERAQLIAILETTLNVLKSPMVERSMTRRAMELLGRAGEKVAEKKVQEGLGHLTAKAYEGLESLAKLIFPDS